MLMFEFFWNFWDIFSLQDLAVKPEDNGNSYSDPSCFSLWLSSCPAAAAWDLGQKSWLCFWPSVFQKCKYLESTKKLWVHYSARFRGSRNAVALTAALLTWLFVSFSLSPTESFCQKAGSTLHCASCRDSCIAAAVTAVAPLPPRCSSCQAFNLRCTKGERVQEGGQEFLAFFSAGITQSSLHSLPHDWADTCLKNLAHKSSTFHPVFMELQLKFWALNSNWYSTWWHRCKCTTISLPKVTKVGCK